MSRVSLCDDLVDIPPLAQHDNKRYAEDFLGAGTT
jgi:hypothetical protein